MFRRKFWFMSKRLKILIGVNSALLLAIIGLLVFGNPFQKNIDNKELVARIDESDADSSDSKSLQNDIGENSDLDKDKNKEKEDSSTEKETDNSEKAGKESQDSKPDEIDTDSDSTSEKKEDNDDSPWETGVLGDIKSEDARNAYGYIINDVGAYFAEDRASDNSPIKYYYYLIKMKPQDSVPALLLCMGEENIIDSDHSWVDFVTRVFYYDTKESKMVAPTDRFYEGHFNMVTSFPLFAADGYGLLSFELVSAEEITADRIYLDGDNLGRESLWTGTDSGMDDLLDRLNGSEIKWNEITGAETSTEKQDAVLSIDADTQYNANVFISNFAEQPQLESIASSSELVDLLDFVHMHTYFNDYNGFSYEEMFSGMTLDYVNKKLKRFFDISIDEKQLEKLPAPEYDSSGNYWGPYYANGKVYYVSADGLMKSTLAVVNTITDNGDGTLTMNFTKWEHDYLSDESFFRESDYYLSGADAKNDSSLKYVSDGTAIVKPYKDGSKDSYQLIEYSLG